MKPLYLIEHDDRHIHSTHDYEESKDRYHLLIALSREYDKASDHDKELLLYVITRYNPDFNKDKSYTWVAKLG